MDQDTKTGPETIEKARRTADALRRALPGMRRQELRNVFWQVQLEARETAAAIGAEVEVGRLKSGCLLALYFSRVDRANIILCRRATRLHLQVAVEAEIRDWINAAEFLADPPEISRKAAG